MRKWIILGVGCLLAAMAAKAMPFERHDVAQLVPVEALVVSVENGKIKLDGGACTGFGDTWSSALQDLQQSAEGTVFLGTTEYIVLAGGAVKLLSEITRSEVLRPAAGICASLGRTPSPEKAAAYLSAHETGVTLHEVQLAQFDTETIQLPILVETEGGLRLYAKADR